jgi:hypothetical protein
LLDACQRELHANNNPLRLPISLLLPRQQKSPDHYAIIPIRKTYATPIVQAHPH